MKSNLVLIVLVAFMAIQNLHSQDFAKVEKVFAQEMEDSSTNGAVLAIIHGDRVIYQKAFGFSNVETKTPVSTNMLFQIGSLTKLFTATALLMLAEEGKIRMDRPVSELIAGLEPCLARVTPQQLLSHTAGIKDEPAEFGKHEESALEEFVHQWKSDYCLLAPGTGFSYSNPGYSLAGLLIEKASGKKYADYMQETIFQPLGMSNTAIRPTVVATYPLALGYRNQAIVRPIADDTRFWPAGYIYTNASDFSRFLIALLNSGMIEGKQIISRSVVTELLQTPVPVPTDEQFQDSHYGYGLFSHNYRGTHLYEHVGSMPGYSAHLWFMKESLSAVLILSNNERPQFRKTLDTALEGIVKFSADSQPQSFQTVPLSAKDAEHFSGEYANRWTFELKFKEGKLFLKHFGLELPADRIGERRFLVKPPWAPEGAVFILGPEKNGRPEYLQIYLWIFERI